MGNKCPQTVVILIMMVLATSVHYAHALPNNEDANVTAPTAAEKRLAAYHQSFEPTGETKNCINTRMIRSTTIIDQEHILFRLSHGRYALNKLPSTCHSLRKGRTFAYSPISMRLCSVDTITVLDSHTLHGSRAGIRSGHRGILLNGPRCGLGQFSIVTKREELATHQSMSAKELAQGL